MFFQIVGYQTTVSTTTFKFYEIRDKLFYKLKEDDNFMKVVVSDFAILSDIAVVKKTGTKNIAEIAGKVMQMMLRR